jgi:hypothetical protein
MTPHEREILEALLRELRELPAIVVPDERAVMVEAQRELERRRRQALGWMDFFVNRQGTVLPDFDALYEKKDDFDDRLLGDGNP